MIRGNGRTVGPYGTNAGDKWLGTDSPVGQMLMERDGKTLVFEMMVKDGVLQECMYVTDNAELIAEATKGHELYVAVRAGLN